MGFLISKQCTQGDDNADDVGGEGTSLRWLVLAEAWSQVARGTWQSSSIYYLLTTNITIIIIISTTTTTTTTSTITITSTALISKTPRFSKFKRMGMDVFEQLLPKRWGPALILAAGCSDAERLSKLKSTKCPQSVHPKVNWSRFSLALVSRKIFVFMKLVLFFKSQTKANIMQQAQKLVQVDALKVLCNVL